MAQTPSKKSSASGRFTFNKLGTHVHYALWDKRGKNLLVGQATSLKKAVAQAALLRAIDKVTFTVKHVASGKKPHFYFQAVAGSAKLGGAGGFATEAAAVAAVREVSQCAPAAFLDTDFAASKPRGSTPKK